MTQIDRVDNELKEATEIIFAAAHRKIPVVVAVDGRSGAGKTTFAKHLAENTKGIIIPLDDFYSAEIPNKKWDEYSIYEKLDKVYNWDRFIRTALKPLLQGEIACWTTYDFSTGVEKNGTYRQQSELKKLNPCDIIIVDGTYSVSQAIIELIDITILINVPKAERDKRLSNREDVIFLKKWHDRWDKVEDYYFNEIRPKEFYDLVISL